MGKFIDETGNRYGRVVVVGRVENDRQGNAVWMCKCDCGESYESLGVALRAGKLPRCKCDRPGPRQSGTRASLDITGREFGFLTAVRRSVVWDKWVCKCACGSVNEFGVYGLLRGSTKSCGCERNSMIASSKVTHGLSRHPLYEVWTNMCKRCYSKNSNRYHRYGGRGIKVCREWREDVRAFYDWAISNSWKKNLQLDRVDNDGDYEPANCRFVTPMENSHNRASTRKNTTGLTGVAATTNGRFSCCVRSNSINDGELVHIGTFDTLKEAVEARNKYIIDNNLPHRIQTYVETSD